jgi:hypothetical protein
LDEIIDKMEANLERIIDQRRVEELYRIENQKKIEKAERAAAKEKKRIEALASRERKRLIDERIAKKIKEEEDLKKKDEELKSLCTDFINITVHNKLDYILKNENLPYELKLKDISNDCLTKYNVDGNIAGMQDKWFIDTIIKNAVKDEIFLINDKMADKRYIIKRSFSGYWSGPNGVLCTIDVGNRVQDNTRLPSKPKSSFCNCM